MAGGPQALAGSTPRRAEGLLGASKSPVSIRYWQARPLGDVWPLLAAIALLFSILPVLGDVHALGRQPRGVMAANIAVTAAFVIATFWASIRRRFAVLTLVVAAFVVSLLALGRSTDAPLGPLPPADVMTQRLGLDVALIAGAVSASYSLFLVFLFRESGVLARLRAEVELAALIHARLVPPVDTRVDGWQAFGASVASSEMGGDLLDVLPGPPDRPSRWTAYVADVSGHGVGAGVFMGVVKTALRMALRQHEDVATALVAANSALHDQKRRDMFATLALVRGGDDGALTACVAGHLPILHWSAATGRVTDVAQRQLPLGALRAQSFAVVSLRGEPDDLLAIVSDGITEVFDASDNELGLDAVRACLAARGSEPLPAIHDALVRLARGHGPIRDDETILLLRRDKGARVMPDA